MAPKAPEKPRQLGQMLALVWTVALIGGLALTMFLVQGVQPALLRDGVSIVLLQVIVYLLALALMLRLHMPHRTLGEAAGLRGTSWYLMAGAPLVGVALIAPVHGLGALTEWLVPMPQEIHQAYEERLAMDTPARALALSVGVVVFVPVVEELVFRGALFSLVQRHEGAAAAVVATALSFTLVHWGYQPPLWVLLPALTLSALRMVSGSLLPGLIAHAVFNGVSVVGTLLGATSAGEAFELPLWALVVGWPALLLVLGVFLLLARNSEAAAAARARDLAALAPAEG